MIRAITLAVSCCAMMMTGALAQPGFKDALQRNPDETCSTGVPEPGALFALSLEGMKGSNYLEALKGPEGMVRLEGTPSGPHAVFQTAPASKPGALALYNLGTAKFVEINEELRLFARAEAAGATLVEIQEEDGYIRLKLAGVQGGWLQVAPQGLADFKVKNKARADRFCASIVEAD